MTTTEISNETTTEHCVGCDQDEPRAAMMTARITWPGGMAHLRGAAVETVRWCPGCVMLGVVHLRDEGAVSVDVLDGAQCHGCGEWAPSVIVAAARITWLTGRTEDVRYCGSCLHVASVDLPELRGARLESY